MSQITLGSVGVDFAGVPIISDVTFTISRGDRWGVVGRNGTGKTTLVNVIAGRLDPTRGSVGRAAGLRITLLDQHREAQAKGRGGIFSAYRLRVAQVLRDYSMDSRKEAPEDSLSFHKSIHG